MDHANMTVSNQYANQDAGTVLFCLLRAKHPIFQQPVARLKNARDDEVAKHTKSAEYERYQNKRRDKSNVI
jgi:hypothetical protein